MLRPGFLRPVRYFAPLCFVSQHLDLVLVTQLLSPR